MGIDLGGRDVGMAQHLLHRPEIRSTRQQVAGKGMAQHMRRNLGPSRSGDRQRLELQGEMLAGQSPPSPCEGNSHGPARLQHGRVLQIGLKTAAARSDTGTIRSRPPLPLIARMHRPQ